MMGRRKAERQRRRGTSILVGQSPCWRVGDDGRVRGGKGVRMRGVRENEAWESGTGEEVCGRRWKGGRRRRRRRRRGRGSVGGGQRKRKAKAMGNCELSPTTNSARRFAAFPAPSCAFSLSCKSDSTHPTTTVDVHLNLRQTRSQVERTLPPKRVINPRSRYQVQRRSLRFLYQNSAQVHVV